jgi:tetratricopeptide (TPR) repeat protein
LCFDAALLVSLSRPGQARRLANRGLAALHDRRSAARAGLLALAASFEGGAGRFEKAEEMFDQALALARAADDGRVLGTTLYLRAYNYFLYLEDARCVEVGREAMGHLRRTSDLWTLASAAAHVGGTLAWMGRFDEGASVAEEGKTLGRKLGNWSAYYAADRARSFRHLGRDPDLGRLESDGTRDYETGRRLGVDWLSATGAGRIGLAAFWAGRWPEALERYHEAAQLDPGGTGAGHTARIFLCNAYLGNAAEALTLVAQTRPSFARAGRANSALSWISAMMAVEALALVSEDDAAAELYPVVMDLVGKGTVLRSWDFRLLETLAGIAASCARDWDAAEGHFRASLRLARELPMRIEEPEARRFYARMLLRRSAEGDTAEAVHQLQLAEADYVAIGMPAHASLVRALLEDASAPRE